MASSERDLEIGDVNGLLEFNPSLNGECSTSPASNTINFGESAIENIEVLTDNSSLGGDESQEHVALLATKFKEKNKKGNPYRPPRPPKGPALDVTDMKLIKELSELAMRKRMRNERVKALKRKRAAKASSSSSSLLAMIFTIIFCLVIVFQGIWSRGCSDSNIQGPLEPVASAVNKGGLISVEYPKNVSPEEGPKASFASLNRQAFEKREQLLSSGALSSSLLSGNFCQKG